MLVATAAQATRKVSIGSQLPASCGTDTVTLPSACAGIAANDTLPSASAVRPARIPLLMIFMCSLLYELLIGHSRHEMARGDLVVSKNGGFVADGADGVRDLAVDPDRCALVRGVGNRDG